MIHLKEMVLESIIDMSKDFSGKLHQMQCTHGVQEFTTPKDSFSCDICGKPQPRGVLMYGCRICNWDICFECHVSGVFAADSVGKKSRFSFAINFDIFHILSFQCVQDFMIILEEYI